MPHPLLDELRRTVDTALATSDPAAAAAALRSHGREVAAEDGAALRALVSRLPEAAWQHDPIIASAMGASYRSPGSPAGSAALGYFRAAEAALAAEAGPPDAAWIDVSLGHAAALRRVGGMAEARRHVERAVAFAQAHPLSVPLRVELGARSGLEAALLDLHRGDVASARRGLLFAHGLATGTLTRAERIECLGGLAVVEYFRADFDAANAYASQGRLLAEGTALLTGGFGAPSLAAQSLVALERDDLETAAALEPALAVAASHGDWEPWAHVIAASLRLADGRHAEGLDRLELSRSASVAWPAPGFVHTLGELVRAELLVTLDQGDDAWAILRDLPAVADHLLCPATVVAQLRLAHGDLAGAAEALSACGTLADDHAPRTILAVRVLRAAVEFERGEYAVSDFMFDRALATMSRTSARSALRMIPAGSLAGLARRALARRHDPEVAGILSALAQTPDEPGRAVEPLSPREILVLAEVEKGSTVAAIAGALYISPNTVKTHLRRLYRKLGVATRAEAIRKAKSLGLGRAITRESPAPGRVGAVPD